MNRTLICAALLGASFASAQNDLAPEVLALSRIKRTMQENLSKLPDYTCLETIARSERANDSSLFRPRDSLRLEVLHAGNKEMYAWPGSKKFEEDIGRLIGAGASSSGEFALHARSIFLGNTQYKYAGPVAIRGRSALKYDYTIPLLSSGMRLSYAGKSGLVSMTGSFWVDPKTLDLLRLDVHAGDIPAELPYRSAASTVDYGRVRIGRRDTLLPQTAEVELKMGSGVADRNEIQFSQCRGFRTESEIRFDAGTDFDLPAGIELPLLLETPIDSNTANEGDLITAKMEQDVKRKNDVVIPAAAIVHGRIRRFESYDQPQPHVIVSIEFTDVEFGDQRAAFTAMLDHADQTPGITWMLAASKSRRTPDADLPGVGTFSVDGKDFQLPAGLHTTWRTVDVKKR